MDKLIVGVDIGGTWIRAGLCNARGEIIQRAKAPTPAREEPEVGLERIKSIVREVLTDRVEAIGVGAPGPLDPWRGVIVKAPNLERWKDVHLKDVLEEEFGLPVYVGNDCNVAALAEQHFGAGQGVKNLIYITVSTGIGGGIIVDDRLLLGGQGFAAEVGHQTIDVNGPRCKCGNIGCLEALASGSAIARRAVELIEKGRETAIAALVGGDLTKVTAEVVNEAARRGDELAIELIQQAGFYIGVGIVNLLHLFNPEMVIIGGGVSKAGDLLFEPIRSTVRERAMMDLYWEKTPIVPSTLGDDVGILGAVALVLSQLA